MRTSLRLQIIFRLLLAMFVVVLANRYLAKFLVAGEIYSSTGREMSAGMQTCGHLLNVRTDFLECYEETNKSSLTSHIAETMTMCAADGRTLFPADSNICHESSKLSVTWFDEFPKEVWIGNYAPLFVKRGWLSTYYSGFEWMGVHEQADGRPWLMVRTTEIERFLDAIWQIRDNHLIYVLPTIFFLIAIVGIWLIRAVMEPVKRLEASFQALTPGLLASGQETHAQYIEFETIFDLYRDMCVRLDESFHRVRGFTSHASHELKTPLTILRGTAQRLIAELPTGSGVQIMASSVADEVERLISISDQLLLLSRADANALVVARQDFHLSEFLDELADDAVIYEKSLDIHKRIESGVVWYCDAVLAKQLIHNLYTNAVKYNVPQGRIDFELSRQQGNFELRISNSSAGVSKELAERAFDRFYRGDASRARSVDGLGLGLSICLEIAKAHHGKLKFDWDNARQVTLTLRAPLRF